MNLRTALTALAGVLLFTPFAAADLLSYWPLDETEGEIATDIVGANDAAWQNPGANLTWTTGRVGGAAELNDVGGNNYFQFNFPELIGVNAITIAAWIDPDSNPGYNGIFMTRTFNGAANNSWGIAIENSPNDRLDTRVNGPGIDSADGLLAAEGWIHVAMVWDGNAGTHTQYVNGIETNTTGGAALGPIAGPVSGPWYIGYDDCCGGTRDFDGLIDEVAVWDEVLPADKIALLAAGTRPDQLSGADLDGDGMPNSYEDMFAFLNPDDPDDAAMDQDGDGLTNLEEFQHKTDPEDTDSDDDNLSDSDEVNIHQTNPNRADTDSDGINDDEELVSGADGFVTNPLLRDSDRDGFSDGDEIAAGTDPTDANDPLAAERRLIGHWPLDESSGTVAADLVSGNDGLWQNGDGVNLEWTTGQIGGAARLSDLGGDSFFRIETISELVSSNQLTITAWINPDENPDYNGVVMTRTLDNQINNSWGIAIENTVGSANHLDTRVDKTGIDSPADTLTPDGSWYHVAMVWDGTTGMHTQYINGVQSATAGGALQRQLQATSGPWYIGYDDCCGGNRDFNGLIDDVGMWTQALTAEEILKIYQDGLAGIGIGGAAAGPAVTQFTRSPDGSQLIIGWESADGKLYNVRSETDPSMTDPIDWPIYNALEDIVANPPENSVTIPFPADPDRYFVIEEFNAPPVTIFSDDFESGQGDWTTGFDDAGGNTLWEWGQPANVGPPTANSGLNCFGTNLDSEYALNSEAWLRSPAIDLSTAGGATLVFAQYIDIEFNFDIASVAVLDATDDTKLADVIPSLSAAGFTWSEVSKALPAEVLGKSVKIEFRLFSDELQVFPGWYIDDVMVTVP